MASPAMNDSTVLSARVLTSLQALNAALSEVRQSVSKIDSIAHLRHSLTLHSPGSGAGSGGVQALLVPSPAPVATATALPSPPAGAPVAAASTPSSLLPALTTPVRASTNEAGPASSTDPTILARLLLSPSLKGVGLEEELLSALSGLGVAERDVAAIRAHTAQAAVVTLQGSASVSRSVPATASRHSTGARPHTPPPAGWRSPQSQSRSIRTANTSTLNGAIGDDDEEDTDDDDDGGGGARIAVSEKRTPHSGGGVRFAANAHADDDDDADASAAILDDNDDDNDDDDDEYGSGGRTLNPARQLALGDSEELSEVVPSMASSPHLQRKTGHNVSSAAPSPSRIAAVVPQESSLRRHYVFPRYVDPADDLDDDGEAEDVPFVIVPMSAFDFSVMESRAMVNQARAETAAAAAAASASLTLTSTDSVVGAALPPAAGYSLIDDEPEPRVFEWDGGDTDWPAAPGLEGDESEEVGNSTSEIVASRDPSLPAPRFEAFSLRVVYQAGACAACDIHVDRDK